MGWGGKKNKAFSQGKLKGKKLGFFPLEKRGWEKKKQKGGFKEKGWFEKKAKNLWTEKFKKRGKTKP